MTLQHEAEYQAITLDNNILKGEGYRFSHGVLKQLSQYRERPTTILVPDVVHYEAKKHIATEIQSAITKTDQALRSISAQIGTTPETISQVREALNLPQTPTEEAEARLSQFYEDIGAVRLSAPNSFDMERLMSMYFSIQAPFEDNKNKRKEFPDAIALLTLEKWAHENDSQVLMITKDKGWRDFSETSPCLHVNESLTDALQLLLPHATVSDLVRSIHESQLLAQEHNVLSSVSQAIEESCSDIYFSVEAYSDFTYEYDDEQTMHSDHLYVIGEDGQIDVKVVRIEDSLIVIELTADIVIDATATFHFSVKDGIDKDYFQLGSDTFSQIVEYRTGILVTIEGEFEDGIENLDVSDVEILEQINEVDFGYVSPDLNRYDHD